MMIIQKFNNNNRSYLLCLSYNIHRQTTCSLKLSELQAFLVTVICYTVFYTDHYWLADSMDDWFSAWRIIRHTDWFACYWL